MGVGKRLVPPIQRTEATHEFALESLVERARRGDVDAFRSLFDTYGARVHRYAQVRLGRAEDAQDALQDVFLAVWRGLPGFRYEHPGSFPGWVFAIARTVVAEHQRRTLRRRTVALDEAPEGSEEFEGRVLSRQLLVQELEQLPESQREVLILRFMVGLSAKEIAASLGKTEAAVMAMQMRGLKHLRRRMGRAER
jgi:RNA polymerase sigma-70 factor (ECF subfamily)